MQGMSKREYATYVRLSRGAIRKAKTAERLVLYHDGSINAAPAMHAGARQPQFHVR